LLPFTAALKEGAYYVIAIVLCVIAVGLSKDSSSVIIKTLAALSFFVTLPVSVMLIAWSIVVIALCVVIKSDSLEVTKKFIELFVVAAVHIRPYCCQE
jgi:hypothetical protein